MNLIFKQQQTVLFKYHFRYEIHKNSMDEPEEIISLITEYPGFKPLYQHIYDMCQNVERMMGMFSEELRLMDQNTVRYMMDQMQKELDENAKELQELKQKLQEKENEIKRLKRLE